MKKTNKDYAPLQFLGPARLMAFCDGIFAIVVTLLVLGIDIPEGYDFGTSGLNAFFVELEPSLIAYFTSFLMISIYWMQHHVIFRFVKYTNAKLIWMNILLLMLVSLLPFASKLKALYKFDLEVVIIFAVAHMLCGLTLFLIWRYVIQHKAIQEAGLNARIIQWFQYRILFTPVVCLIAIVISLFSVRIGTYAFLLIPIYLAFNSIRNPAYREGQAPSSIVD